MISQSGHYVTNGRGRDVRYRDKHGNGEFLFENVGIFTHKRKKENHHDPGVSMCVCVFVIARLAK